MEQIKKMVNKTTRRLPGFVQLVFNPLHDIKLIDIRNINNSVSRANKLIFWHINCKRKIKMIQIICVLQFFMYLFMPHKKLYKTQDFICLNPPY